MLAQYSVTRVLAEAPSLYEAAPQILKSICETLEWAVGTVWQLDKEKGFCVVSRPGTFQSQNVIEFSAVTRSRTFDRGIGLPGRVWENADALWIEDVTSRRKFPSCSDRFERRPAQRIWFPNSAG